MYVCILWKWYHTIYVVCTLFLSAYHIYLGNLSILPYIELPSPFFRGNRTFCGMGGP